MSTTVTITQSQISELKNVKKFTFIWVYTGAGTYVTDLLSETGDYVLDYSKNYLIGSKRGELGAWDIKPIGTLGRFPTEYYLAVNPSTYLSDGLNGIHIDAPEANGASMNAKMPISNIADMVFMVKGMAPPVSALAWVNQPSTGTENTNIIFSWSGGDNSTTNYNLVVYESDGVTIADEQTIPFNAGNGSATINESVGTYIVKVYDKGGRTDTNANVISQQIILLSVPKALSWITPPPSTVISNDIIHIAWEGGNPTAAGYEIHINDYQDSYGNKIATVKDTSYDLTIPLFSTDTIRTITVYDGVRQVNGVTSIKSQITIKPPVAKWRIKNLDVVASSNVEMYVDDDLITNGLAGWVYGVKLEFKCKSGFQFKNDAVTDKPSMYIISNDSGKLYGEFNSDNTSSIYLPFTSPGSSNNYTAVLTTEQKAPDIKGSNHVYSPSKDDLNRINARRFVNEGDGNGGTTLVDYGQFILSLIELPFTIPPEYVMLSESVKLATLNTQVMVPTLNSDRIKFDMGSIHIPQKFSDLYDYNSTTAILYLPHSPAINLDLEYVIGQEIKISYIIDVYTGKATILITSSKTDGVISQKEVDLGIKIPYINIATTNVDNGNIVVGGDNGIKIPYIEIVRNDAILQNGIFSIPVIDENTLDTVTGFTRIEEIELVTRANNTESVDIISILNKGVIIK